jgi:hypothetical protein
MTIGNHQHAVGKKWLRFGMFSTALLVVITLSVYLFETRLTGSEKTSQLKSNADQNRIVIPPLNAENVYKSLLEHGIKHPEIVVKQTILETGWYKCKYCSLSENNIFGFRKKQKISGF